MAVTTGSTGRVGSSIGYVAVRSLAVSSVEFCLSGSKSVDMWTAKRGSELVNGPLESGCGLVLPEWCCKKYKYYQITMKIRH